MPPTGRQQVLRFLHRESHTLLSSSQLARFQRRWCTTTTTTTSPATTTTATPSPAPQQAADGASPLSSSSTTAVELGPHADRVSLMWDEIIAAKTARDNRYSRTPTGNVLADNTRALQTETLEAYSPKQRPIYSPQTGRKTITRDASRGYRSVDGGKLLVSETFLQHTGEGANASTPPAATNGKGDAVDAFRRPEDDLAFPPLPPQHVGRQRRHSYVEAEVGPYAPGGRLHEAERDDVHKTTVVSVWDDPDAGKDEQMSRVIKARRDHSSFSPTGAARKEREELAKEKEVFLQDPEAYYRRFYNEKHRLLDGEGNVLRGDSSLLGLEGNRREQRHYHLPVKGDGAIPEDPVLLKNPNPKAQDDYVYGRQYPSLPGRSPTAIGGSVNGGIAGLSSPPTFNLRGGGDGEEAAALPSSPSPPTTGDDAPPPPPDSAMADMLSALRGGGSGAKKSTSSHFENLLKHKAGEGESARKAAAPKAKVINEDELRRDILELNFWQDANGYDDKLKAFQKKYPSHDPETGAPLVRRSLYSDAEIAAGLEGEPLDLNRASPDLRARLASNPASSLHPSILASDLLSSRSKPSTGINYQSPQAKEMLELEAEMARHMALRADADANTSVEAKEDHRGALEKITGLDPIQQKQVRLCMSDFDIKDGMTTLYVMQSYPYVDGLTFIAVVSIGATLLFLQDWYHMIDYYEEVIGLDSRKFPRARRYIYMGVVCGVIALALHPITIGSIWATRVYRIAMRRPIGPP